jgi:hypothetical protein
MTGLRSFEHRSSHRGLFGLSERTLQQLTGAGNKDCRGAVGVDQGDIVTRRIEEYPECTCKDGGRRGPTDRDIASNVIEGLGQGQNPQGLNSLVLFNLSLRIHPFTC